MKQTVADLIESNVELLEQASDVLAGVEDGLFARTVPGMPSLRVGAHLRHVLEFYECFFEGLVTRFIDYESRRRETRVETSREFALARIAFTIDRLGKLAEMRADAAIHVRPEDAPAADEPLISTVARELQVLSSHTVHHFALIAVTLQAFGRTVPASFGVSAATLRYREAAA